MLAQDYDNIITNVQEIQNERVRLGTRLEPLGLEHMESEYLDGKFRKISENIDVILNSENGPRVKNGNANSTGNLIRSQTKKIIERLNQTNNQDPHEEMEGFIHGMTAWGKGDEKIASFVKAMHAGTAYNF